MAATTTISGAVSGLDTASLINQLVTVQKSQQTLLATQQSAVQKRADAYASLSSSLNALSTQAAELAKTSQWAGASAASSSTGVTATATGLRSASLTFDVTAIATAHTLVSGSALTSVSAQAASGPLTLTRSDGTTASIDVGSGSLSDVVAGINNSNTGLVAASVQTGPGAYRVQVASAATGSTSSFTLDGLDGFSSTEILAQGADATLHLGGTSPAAYDVTSSTNTFGSLVSGLSFSVSKPESNVTVSSTVDGSAVADKINALVNTANAILSGITASSTYNTSTKAAGPFTGVGAVRTLSQSILSAVSSVGAPGVGLTRNGSLTFDRQKFLDAFKADPAKVTKAFGAAGTFIPTAGVSSTAVSVSKALPSARAGSYAVQVTSAPQREAWELDAPGGDLSGQTVALTRGSATVSYTAGVGESLTDTATAFNSAAAAAGFGVSARVVGSTLQFTADLLGSAHGFSAALDGVDGSQLTAGADVVGSIDGQAGTGVGGVLSLPTGTGGAVGLSLDVTATDADLAASGGSLGSLRYTPGLAQRLVTLVNDATNSGTGAVTTAQRGATAEVKRYQKDIDTWDLRLTAYRETLTRQFTAMETAIASLKTQTSAIASLVNSSSSGNSSSS